MKPEAIIEVVMMEECVMLPLSGAEADGNDALSRENDADKLLFFEVFE